MPGGGLGGQVRQVEGGGFELDGLGPDHLEPLSPHGFNLVRIVGQQDEPSLLEAEQRGCMHHIFVIAVVLFQAHGRIGLEGGNPVLAGLHQHAVPRLGNVADAPALLHEVEQNPVFALGDGFQGPLELLHAVAIAAPEGFAGDAGRVDPGMQSLSGAQVAVGQSDDVSLVDEVLEDMRLEGAIAGVEGAGGHIQGRAMDGTVHTGLLAEGIHPGNPQLREPFVHILFDCGSSGFWLVGGHELGSFSAEPNELQLVCQSWHRRCSCGLSV